MRTPETSAFKIYLTFINLFDKTQFLFHPPTDAAPQFLWKLEITLLHLLTQSNRPPLFLNFQLTNYHLTLKMASAQVVEASVANNSPSQDSNHPDHFHSMQSLCSNIFCRNNTQISCRTHVGAAKLGNICFCCKVYSTTFCSLART